MKPAPHWLVTAVAHGYLIAFAAFAFACWRLAK